MVEPLSPYFTGDNIPLSFRITDKDGDVEPEEAELYILCPVCELWQDPNGADIDGNEVTYIVPKERTGLAGKYKFYFVLTLPTYGIRTAKLEREVFHNP